MSQQVDPELHDQRPVWLDPYKLYCFKEADKVKIISGPMRGYVGCVVKDPRVTGGNHPADPNDFPFFESSPPNSDAPSHHKNNQKICVFVKAHTIHDHFTEKSRLGFVHISDQTIIFDADVLSLYKELKEGDLCEVVRGKHENHIAKLIFSSKKFFVDTLWTVQLTSTKQTCPISEYDLLIVPKMPKMPFTNIIHSLRRREEKGPSNIFCV